MTLTSFYGIKLPVTVEDIIQQEKRHIKVLFLRRLMSLKNG
jgi:hypothetical protein